MSNEMTIYECADLMRLIEQRAAMNEGEISESDLQALVLAQTTSIEKLGKLCGYLRHLEGGIELCKIEENRIATMRKRAENRLDSIKKFLLPYVKEYRERTGHPLRVGTFSLSKGTSARVDIDELAFYTPENKKDWCVHKESWDPAKDKIKAAIKEGQSIVGVKVTNSEYLTVK